MSLGTLHRLRKSTLRDGRIRMMDAILIGLGLGFFALSVGYAYACERL
jgi:hypothetical protein